MGEILAIVGELMETKPAEIFLQPFNLISNVDGATRIRGRFINIETSPLFTFGAIVVLSHRQCRPSASHLVANESRAQKNVI